MLGDLGRTHQQDRGLTQNTKSQPHTHSQAEPRWQACSRGSPARQTRPQTVLRIPGHVNWLPDTAVRWVRSNGSSQALSKTTGQARQVGVRRGTSARRSQWGHGGSQGQPRGPALPLRRLTRQLWSETPQQQSLLPMADPSGWGRRESRPASLCWAPGASRREAGAGWGLGRRAHFYFLLPEAQATSGPGRGKGVSGRRGRSIWAVGLHLGAKGWRWAPAQAAGSVGVIDCVCPQGWPPADTELLHGLNYSFLGSTTSRWLERRGLNSYFV